MDFYLQIAENQRILNPGEEKILSNILNMKNEIEHYTVRQIASMNFVAPNSIIRMCKKLGFSGYTEFKTALKSTESKGENAYTNYPVDFFEELQRTTQLLPEKRITEILKVIKDSYKIALFSSGLSRYVAEELEERFRLIGRKVHSFSERETKLHCAKRLTCEDCVLVFSISGEESSSIDAVTIAKNNGAKIISVTGFSNNTISQLAQYPIFIFCTPQFHEGIDITNRLLFSYIASLLFQKYIETYL